MEFKVLVTPVSCGDGEGVRVLKRGVCERCTDLDRSPEPRIDFRDVTS